MRSVAEGGIRLAEADFQGPTRAYEGKFGFFHAYLQGHAADVGYAAISDRLGDVWSCAETAVKPYPVCHFVHGCADAAIDLHQRVDPGEIASVEAFLPKATMPIVAEPAAAKERPTTDYEAKFSAQRRGRTRTGAGGRDEEIPRLRLAATRRRSGPRDPRDRSRHRESNSKGAGGGFAE